jgi:carbonic anhydrase
MSPPNATLQPVRGRSDAQTALRRLLEGNARYQSGVLRHGEHLAEQRSDTAEEQRPYAVILGCSDSRVPPQLIFDQGPGDLFTTRVAGHVATDAVTATIEYAVERLGVPLIVVLGHDRCGAVTACLHGGVEPGGRLGHLLREIEPAVERARGVDGDPLENTIRFHVENVVQQLRESEPVLADRVRSGDLEIVGALYDLETGAVRLTS